MVRSKREFRCDKCSGTQIKWEGICRKCGAAGSLQEIVLLPTTAKPTGLDAARKTRRRAKDSERGIAKRMVAADGPDPAYAKIASSTGRIGHITGIRVDAISRTYVTENKNRKMPTWLIDAWVLINQRGKDFGKNVLLHIEPPNMPKEIRINGRVEKLDTLAVITQSRHEDLIRSERALAIAIDYLNDNPDLQTGLNAVFEALQGHNS